MDIIYNKIFLEHDTGMHPENRKRLESIGGLNSADIPNGEDFLNLIHTTEYINRVKAHCAAGGHLDADTAVSKHSYEAACYAVGATLEAAEQGGFAVVRPPGHHAYPDHSSGFCVFNNISIAATHLRNQNKRVLIFDFDGHLGDGTERIFYENDRVMYWSMHQLPAFPGWGSENEIGEGKGKGFTINVPLPPGSGDDLFMRAFEEYLKVAVQFEPDIVAVSAGFDAHHSDLLLDLRLSANVYYYVGQALARTFANIFATLEGGYNIEMLPKCLNNFLHGINGKPIYFEEPPTSSEYLVIEEFELRLSGLKKNLKGYWKQS